MRRRPIASRPDSGRFIAINAQRRTHHNRGHIPASVSRIDGTSSRPAGRHPDFTAAASVKGLSVGGHGRLFGETAMSYWPLAMLVAATVLLANGRADAGPADDETFAAFEWFC